MSFSVASQLYAGAIHESWCENSYQQNDHTFIHLLQMHTCKNRLQTQTNKQKELGFKVQLHMKMFARHFAREYPVLKQNDM